MLIFPFRDAWRRYRAIANQQASGPFKVGIYDVRTYVVNGDTIPPFLPVARRRRV